MGVGMSVAAQFRAQQITTTAVIQPTTNHIYIYVYIYIYIYTQYVYIHINMCVCTIMAFHGFRLATLLLLGSRISKVKTLADKRVL